MSIQVTQGSLDNCFSFLESSRVMCIYLEAQTSSEGAGLRALKYVVKEWRICVMVAVNALAIPRGNDFPATFVTEPEASYDNC